MTKCKAPVFVGANKQLEVREFELPTLHEGEALVKMKISGICGTDVHMWRNPKTPTPMIFGHENVGTISSLGLNKKFDAVGQEIHEGDHVVFGGIVSCGECYSCSVVNEPTTCERGFH